MTDHTNAFRDPARPSLPVIPRAEWDRSPYNRWTFQHIREILPTARVWRGNGVPSSLGYALEPVEDIAFSHDRVRRTVGEVLDETFTDGFLVIRKGKIAAEIYRNGMLPHTLHLSQSVAKSVTGVVAGIMISRGEMKIDAPLTNYLPELGDTAYRGATVQHVLDMTSGVLFDETYTADASHMAKLDAASGWKDPRGAEWPDTVWKLILSLTEEECPHGSSFRYRSIETDVLAFAMQRISGLSLAELVSRELWAPMGAEEDACFTVDQAGYGLADGGFNATLRDYGRFGLMLCRGGACNARQIVPESWVDGIAHGNHDLFGEADRHVLPKGAYHNQFWIEEAGRPIFMARGVFGQLIYIDREADFVAVKLSSWPEFSKPERTRLTLAAIRAIRDMI